MMEALVLLAISAVVVGPILSVVGREALVDAPLQAAKRQAGQWSGLSAVEQFALLERLQKMSPAHRSSVASEYLPVRERMARLAASNGIDPSFLYE